MLLTCLTILLQLCETMFLHPSRLWELKAKIYVECKIIIQQWKILQLRMSEQLCKLCKACSALRGNTKPSQCCFSSTKIRIIQILTSESYHVINYHCHDTGHGPHHSAMALWLGGVCIAQRRNTKLSSCNCFCNITYLSPTLSHDDHTMIILLMISWTVENAKSLQCNLSKVDSANFFLSCVLIFSKSMQILLMMMMTLMMMMAVLIIQITVTNVWKLKWILLWENTKPLWLFDICMRRTQRFMKTTQYDDQGDQDDDARVRMVLSEWFHSWWWWCNWWWSLIMTGIWTLLWDAILGYAAYYDGGGW